MKQTCQSCFSSQVVLGFRLTDPHLYLFVVCVSCFVHWLTIHFLLLLSGDLLVACEPFVGDYWLIQWKYPKWVCGLFSVDMACKWYANVLGSWDFCGELFRSWNLCGKLFVSGAVCAKFSYLGVDIYIYMLNILWVEIAMLNYLWVEISVLNY